MANYSGEQLAAKGVVYVALAYRVGALGFLAHPELSAESPQHVSGNYGFLDQIAALQWIQRNIARFGGDPGNVTIMGQSAGSASVSVLQASPLSRGLFHRAVGMSGGALGANMGRARPLERCRAMGARAANDSEGAIARGDCDSCRLIGSWPCRERRVATDRWSTAGCCRRIPMRSSRRASRTTCRF